MTSAIEKLTAYTPVIASSSLFALRRLDKGINAMDDKPLFGVANLGIGTAQMYKGLLAAGAVHDLVSASESIRAVNSTVKGLSFISKTAKFFGKALETVASNINGFIIGASLIKVLGSDDKEDTFKRELVRDVSMLGIFEVAAKKLFGIPKLGKNAEGKLASVSRDALYKKIPYLKELGEKFVKYCENNKLFNKIPLTSIPGALKGLALVLFSIEGYKVGDKLAEKWFGKEKCNNTNNEGRCFVTYPDTTPQTIALHG